MNNSGAIDVLMRRGQNAVPAGILLWLCVALLAMSAGFAPNDHLPWLFCAQFVLAGALPFCYSWDSRLLDRVKRHRFLDMALMTGLSPSEWSDTLVVRSLRSLVRMAWVPCGVVFMLTAVLTPQQIPQCLCWLATLVALTLTLSYVHQLSVSLTGRFGREVRIVASSGLMAVLAWYELTQWATLNLRSELNILAVSVPALLVARWLVQRRLNALMNTGENAPSTLAASFRPWSHNLIVIRESWRSARRGGLLAVACRRYLPFIALTAWVAQNVYSVGVGRGPWFIYYDASAQSIVAVLALYVLAGSLLVYWSTLSAIQGERTQEASVLLQTTGLRASEYLDGWIDFATRYRYLEILSIYSVGLMGMVGCWWASQGWSHWVKAEGGFHASVIIVAVGMGLMTLTLMRCIACLALWTSSQATTWLAKQLSLFTFLLPYVIAAAAVNGLTSALLTALVGATTAQALGWTAVVILTWHIYGVLRQHALQSISDGDDALDCLAG